MDHHLDDFLNTLNKGKPGEKKVNQPSPPSQTSTFSTTTSSSPTHRLDPRTSERLVTRKIRNPKTGKDVEIDVNPRTGGVFLDKGELEELSQIPEVVSTLENLLRPQNS